MTEKINSEDQTILHEATAILFSKRAGEVSLITIGVMGMTVALTVAGYGQVLVERAQMGATWEGFFVSQNFVWFVQGLGWRLAMGVVTLVGFIFLVKDLLTTQNSPSHER